MIEILTGGIGETGCIAVTTGRQDVCTTILPPGALAGEQAFRKHFVSCNQTRDPFSSYSNLDYTLAQIRGKFVPRHKAPILLRLLPYFNFVKALSDHPNVLYLRNLRSYNCRAGAAKTRLLVISCAFQTCAHQPRKGQPQDPQPNRVPRTAERVPS